MGAQRKKMLTAFLSGYLEQVDRVELTAAQRKVQSAFPAIADDVDGMTVSKALRAIGFNRDYDAGGPAITYRRKAA